MQLLVAINDIHLRALLDSGLTHNFIDTAATHRASITWQPTSGLQVAVANGDRLNSPGRCHDLCIVISTEPFVIDCYGLELASFKMVLGVQWLESLGPLRWDFGQRMMAFVRNGHRNLWTATDMTPSPPHLLATDDDLMDDLLSQFEAVFVTPVS
jgi:hypothetical protein